jgi:FixJ family two-component response regulator
MGFYVQTFATAKEFTERARVENPSCLVLAHIVEKIEAESVAKLVRMAGQLGLSPGD